MLFQQMKSLHSFKIEENGTLPAPSIAVANNDKTPNELATDRSRLNYLTDGDDHSLTNKDSNCYLPSVTLSKKHSTDRSRVTHLHDRLNHTLLNYYSIYQPQFTRFIFGRQTSNVTSLNKLWYTYSYIYKLFAILFFL